MTNFYDSDTPLTDALADKINQKLEELGTDSRLNMDRIKNPKKRVQPNSGTKTDAGHTDQNAGDDSWRSTLH